MAKLKRDLYMRQEIYLSGKRDLCIMQNRPYMYMPEAEAEEEEEECFSKQRVRRGAKRAS